MKIIKRNFFKVSIILIIISSVQCNKDKSVEPENNPPSCEIISPSNGAQFMKGTNVEFTVDVSDVDGQITQVKYFVDGQLRHEDFSSPFTFVWNTSDDDYGMRVIRVEATDNSGASRNHTIGVTLYWLYTKPQQLNDNWETASLESVGMDSTYLVNLMNTLGNEDDHKVHGILIVRNGRLVFEEYFEGFTHPTIGEDFVIFNRNRPHLLSSVTKSFTSALLGIAIDNGFISGVDEKALSFYPELDYLNTGQRQNISLRHLANMFSGLDWNEALPFSDPNNDLIQFIDRAYNTDEHLAGYILGLDMISEPGTTYNYSGGDYNLIGNIVQVASNLRLDEFANQYLFEPLGIEYSRWWYLRDDFVYASGDIALRLRDIAKFGQLFLQNGNWNGEQIIPEDWVAHSATPSFYFEPPDLFGNIGYSFGWFPKNNDEYGQGAYAANGWGGQRIIVLPEHDMVVIFTGGSYWQAPFMSPHEIMVDYILPAIQ